MKHQHLQITVILFTLMISGLIIPSGVAGQTDSAAGLENATYIGIEDEPVTLLNGRWEGPPYVQSGASRPRVGLLEDFNLKGDLDADGHEETIVLLWQSGGGTGSNIYMAVMKSENGEYRNISTALVGDRVKLRGGKIDSGKIIFDVLQAGENDPMCCPTQLATRTWILIDGQLEENVMEVTGQLSLNVLEGSEWILNRLTREQPLPADAEVTLSFGGGRVSGKSACNRYSADIKQGDSPGDILTGPAMGTRMACPVHLMEIERNYLDSLAHVRSFSFHNGKLALSGQNVDGTQFTMLFSPKMAQHP
jgi:heat shock protein HslJ